jgi:glycosyltransferase involved in cell wall biosynthesis
MPRNMHPKKSEWVTCTPMNFRGCDVYANRDAGLVGQGFRQNGWPCSSILLGPDRDSDLPAVIRATCEELEDPAWWATVAERGVIFYNSTRLIKAPILHAAKAAGLPISLNVDNTGIFDFHSNPFDFWRKATMHKSNLPAPSRLIKASAGVLKSYYQRFNDSYRKFAEHLAIADVIGAVTPEAADRFRLFLANHNQSEAAARVHLIPHPTHPRFVMSGDKPDAENITFVTVGRWDVQRQKRPDLLMAVIDLLLAADTRFRFKIFGKLIPEMERWHAGLDAERSRRVGLHGIVPNAELLEAYQGSHIYLCVSAYESFLIAAAEAMCCGCSIVACNSPTLPGPRWFASGSRGMLADNLNAQDLAKAALLEAEVWREGGRDGNDIADWAQRHMHANHVADTYANLLASQVS